MNTDTLAQVPAERDESDQEPEAFTDQDMDEYLTEEYDYQAPRRGDIRTGMVIEISDQGVVMDIGAKREGFVPTEDLAQLDEQIRSSVEVGASVRVFVLQTADREGRPVLSIHQASLFSDWVKAEEMLASGEIYEGEVSGYNRGGLIVRFGKIRGFVPASQIAGVPRRLSQEERRRRLEAMIGQQVGLKVIEVDRKRRRLIFSHRRALRAWQEVQRARVMETLAEGSTRRGIVTSITDFGAFVDLGGADGLIHISELSWRRVENPREVLKMGDEVDVYVLKVDHARKRIALSMKKLQPDPWTIVDDHYQVGQLVEGRVTRVLDFGAFVELDIGLEGLLHAREMIGTPELSPSDIVHPGETLLVKITRIDNQRKRLDLSARQVRQEEWERWAAERQAAQEAEEEMAAAEEPTAEEETAAEEAVMQAADAAELPGDARPGAESEREEEETTEPQQAEETATEDELAAADSTAGEESAEPEAG